MRTWVSKTDGVGDLTRTVTRSVGAWVAVARDRAQSTEESGKALGPADKLQQKKRGFAKQKTDQLDLLLKADLSKPDAARDRLTQLIVDQVDARSPDRKNEAHRLDQMLELHR